MPLFDAAPRGQSISQTYDKSRILGRSYMPFNNPFFDVASTYLPSTIRSMFGFCRYYYLTHGIINAVTTRHAQYPITDLIIKSKEQGTKKRWEDILLGSMDYRTVQFGINLDYFVYGNAFVTPYFPFVKMLKCANCSADLKARDTRSNWRYINHRFWLQCPRCGQTDFARSRDESVMDSSKVSMVRWNPEQVNVHLNEATGECDYSLNLSPGLRSDVQMGRKDLIASTPEIFLQAVKLNSPIAMDRRRVYHLRRPSLSGNIFNGWGPPLLMPVMKDAFYMQVMKKAQEAIMLTHIVPQHFLFPQPATGGADPFTTTNLKDWKDKIRGEIARQRMDPAYMAILPFPLGHQTIGGDGRGLMLMPEIQQLSEQIVASLGFPVDLVFGSGNYAGTSVSMRMLENSFISNVHDHARLLEWFMHHLSTYLNLPMAEAQFKPFRMADDLQRQAFLFQLQQTQQVSSTTLLAGANLDFAEEMSLIEAETDQRSEAMIKSQSINDKIQGDAMVSQAKMQAKAMAIQQEAQMREQSVQEQDPFMAMQGSNIGEEQQGWSLDATVGALASKLRELPPDKRHHMLRQLTSRTGPELAQMAAEQAQAPEGMPLEMMQQMMAEQAQQPDNVVPISAANQPMPAPEVLPPRRLESQG